MPKTQPRATAADATLPDGVEIFRAGRHIDDAGGVHEFSEADVAAMVAAYDPALREAPLTVGHPKHNLPAYGWVKTVSLVGADRLAMNAHQVEPAFAEMVDAGRFKKRSASFYPPSHPNNPKPGAWYLRHVAFLGAQPPAIAGLRDFAESEQGVVSFGEGDPGNTATDQQQEEDDMDLKEQLAAAEAKTKEEHDARVAAEGKAADSDKKLAEFAEAATNARHAGYVSFAEAQVKAGVVLPKDQAALVSVLDTLAEAQPVSFAEGGATKTVPATDWLKTFIANAKPVVSFGEHAAGSAGDPTATKGESDAEIDAKAKAYQAEHKGVSYAEALSHVTASFTA